MQLQIVLYCFPCHNYLTSLELNIFFSVLAVPLELAVDGSQSDLHNGMEICAGVVDVLLAMQWGMDRI